jgi:hypothetical protein
MLMKMVTGRVGKCSKIFAIIGWMILIRKTPARPHIKENFRQIKPPILKGS